MRYSVLAVPVIIFMSIVMYVSFTFYYLDVRDNAQRDHIQYAVNYSSDAAVGGMLAVSSDLNQDYNESKRAEVNPYVGLRIFENVLLKNLDMVPTVGNRITLEESLPFFIVAAEDGYYVGKFADYAKVKAENGESNYKSKIVFSQKKSYTVKQEGSTDPNTYYIVGINSKDATKVTVTKNTGGDDIITTVKAQRSDVGSERYIKTQISEQINNDALKTLRARFNDTGRQFNVPVQFSSWVNTNPIAGVSVLAYFDPPRYILKKNTQFFGIAGTKITRADFCIGYIKDGIKLYSYAEDLPEAFRDLETNKIFTSPYEAAKAGYSYDYSTFNKR